MRRLIAVAVIAFAALAAPSSASHIPFGDPALPARVTCGGPGEGFALEALRSPTGVERRRGPLGRALRRFIRREQWLFEDVFPKRGWRVLLRTRRQAFLGAGHGPALTLAAFGRRRGRWDNETIGGCTPAPAHPRAVASPWRLDPRAARPGPATTEVRILVTEESCAGGTTARGRIEPPRMFVDGRRVVAGVFVRPRGGLQSCPGNPETPFTLKLPEPLGERPLQDGSAIPARTRFPR